MMAVEVAFKITNTIQTEGVRLHVVPATTERGYGRNSNKSKFHWLVAELDLYT